MHSADASRQAELARVQDELGTASATMHAVERQLQVKGDEALELQQRIVGLLVSLDESRVDAKAQRAKLLELTSRVLEKDAEEKLQSLEGEVRQTEEKLRVQTKVFTLPPHILSVVSIISPSSHDWLKYFCVCDFDSRHGTNSE
jgi:hypothetical protein